MGQLDFRPRTLDDDIVKDGLCAVRSLEDVPGSRESSFVVGGVATQSYFPSVFRRPTSDIDLAVLRPFNYEDFRSFVSPVVEFLCDHGYEAQTKKGHIAYQVIYSKIGEEKTATVIEFPRRNGGNYATREERLQREMRNTRIKIIDDRDETYRVSSPEDIVVPKLVRGVGSLTRNPEFCEYVESSKPIVLTDERVDAELRKIRELREEAVLHVGDIRLVERLRFVSDIFDIRALSEVAGFNEIYLGEAISSWDVLETKTTARDLLINYLLPKMTSN